MSQVELSPQLCTYKDPAKKGDAEKITNIWVNVCIIFISVVLVIELFYPSIVVSLLWQTFLRVYKLITKTWVSLSLKT